jgi:release factor glutamine methyltransferase
VQVEMIYQPSDDSFLLEKQVKKFAKDKKVLDIGSGSGIQAKTALSAGAKSVLATDINPKAVEHLRKIGIHSVKSDLFSNINNKFDLIIFNPPYLPEDKREPQDSKPATTGGKKGDEIILKFLKQAPLYLNPDGSILLLISSLTPQKRINLLLSNLSMTKRILSKKQLFMESLEIWDIANI